MLHLRNNMKGMISEIYECQKKIAVNKTLISHLEGEGKNTVYLEKENNDLYTRINEMQRFLVTKYERSY